MRCRPRGIDAGLLAVVAVFVMAACDGPGNTGKILPDPLLVRSVPWLNGILPALDSNGQAVVPDTAVYPPIASGLPDLGSRPAAPADCAAAAALEFSTGWFDSFEKTNPADPNSVAVAPGWSSYDDLTKYAFHAPGDVTWYPGLVAGRDYEWGLPTDDAIPGPSCDGTPNNYALHLRGGLFRKWGGGISHAFTDPVGLYCTTPPTCPTCNDFCPPAPAAGATVDSAGLPLTAPDGSSYAESHDFFDVSSYDGIAFWARRGPEGFDSSLVILTDKFTSDRLAHQNQKYCRRYRECYPTCLSGAPCSPVPDAADPTKTIYRCIDPADADALSGITVDSERELMYPRCGPSACTSPPTYLDPDFDGKACRPYAFPANDESGYYCWNEGDPPPPDRDERCQDGWQTTVQLTPDWHFYALPWSQFGQVGFGKKAPYMDLKSLDVFAFGALMGWSDAYFDNVTLFRYKP
jgi:hypothetical protein